jgi:ATP-binding protein involved in chromosome partitioning
LPPDEPTLTSEVVLSALKKLRISGSAKDPVTLGWVTDASVENGRVRVVLKLSGPARALRSALEREIRGALAGLPGVSVVEIRAAEPSPSGGRSLGAAIAVGSGKGGVGKSTIAVNLAVLLARQGARVGLLDADIYGPNVPTMMGIARLPPPAGARLLPGESFGVKVISIGFLVPADRALIWRGPMLHKAIRQFVDDVEWGELDYLIVDLPPGTGDAQLSLAQSIALAGGVIVTMPQKVSVEDARRALQMFRTMDVPVLGVVENMSYLALPDGKKLDVFGQGGGEMLAGEAGVPFLGAVPLDPDVRLAGDTGVPIVISHPDSPASLALSRVADAVAERLRSHGEGAELTLEMTD